MTFNLFFLEPHEAQAYLILLCPKLAKKLHYDITNRPYDEFPLSSSEAFALKMAFEIARKTLEQFPQLKEQLLLEEDKTDGC
jgi:hypothetical protein